jgi:hypothetical protein
MMKRWSFLLCLAMIATGLSAPASAQNIEWGIAKENFKVDTAGFISPASITSGNSVSAYVTCPKGTFSLTAYRMGYYAGVGAKPYWNSGSLPCVQQSAQIIDPITHMSESHWLASVQIPTTQLIPGFYLVKIVSSVGHQAYMTLTVRQNSALGTVVMVIPTMTSLAYDRWQGASAYRGATGFSDRARVLSFNRPTDWGYGSGKYLNYVRPLLETADRLGLNIDFVTDVDVSMIPHLLDGARAYVSGGHDEYWTGTERTAVESARNRGTNLLFFGANIAYWQTRLSAEGRQMTIYKSATEDPNKTNPTIRFRSLNRPESILTGQKYNCYPAAGAFTIADPTSFVFRGLKVSKGEKFVGIIGPEVDHTENPTHFVGTLNVVAKSTVTCGTTLKRKTTADMVYGVSPNGAGTISVGTMKWVERGLTKDVPVATQVFVTGVTQNILRAAAKGPLGDQFPR